MPHHDEERRYYRTQEPGRNRYKKMENRMQNSEWGMQEGPFTGVGPKNYKRSDERILEDIFERLTMHGQIDARYIKVNLQDGEVTLDGMVNDRRSKHLVEDVIDQVSGVKDIHNNLKVEKHGQMQSDEMQGRTSWGQGQRSMPGSHSRADSEMDINRRRERW